MTYTHAQSKVPRVLQRTLSTSFEEVIHHLKSVITFRNIYSTSGECTRVNYAEQYVPKVWMTIVESGWNVWVWLVGVVIRRWVWLVGVGGIYGYG